MAQKFLNILAAYPYFKGNFINAIAETKSVRFFLDSGAFTAWKAGKEINLDDYCRFIETLPFKPWRYFALDVVGNPAATMKNYEVMLQRGFNPVPVFTRGEDFSVINDYYKTSDLIGIGGLVYTEGNKGFVKSISERTKGRNIHWLGFGNQDFISYFKPYSCDCSTWANGIRFGVLNIYKGKGLWQKGLQKKNFISRPSREIIDLLRFYDIDPARLARKEEWINTGDGATALQEISQKSWVRYSLDVEKILGTKYFIAITSVQMFLQSYEAFHFWSKKNV